MGQPHPVIVPGLAAGAITLERERAVYETLALTRLRATEVIAGKVLAVLAFVMLPLTLSLPFVSLAFCFGGVSPGEVIVTYLALTSCALTYATLGAYCSTRTRRTAIAALLSYTSAVVFGALALIYFLFPTGLALELSQTLRTVCPLLAVVAAAETEPFYARSIPVWLDIVLVNSLLSALLTALAARRLDLFTGASNVAVRWIRAALWVAVLTLCYGRLIGRLIQASVGGLVVNADNYVMGLLALTIAVVASAPTVFGRPE